LTIIFAHWYFIHRGLLLLLLEQSGYARHGVPKQSAAIENIRPCCRMG